MHNQNQQAAIHIQRTHSRGLGWAVDTLTPTGDHVPRRPLLAFHPKAQTTTWIYMEWFDGTTVLNEAQRRAPTPLAGILKETRSPATATRPLPFAHKSGTQWPH